MVSMMQHYKTLHAERQLIWIGGGGGGGPFCDPEHLKLSN